MGIFRDFASRPLVGGKKSAIRGSRGYSFRLLDDDTDSESLNATQLQEAIGQPTHTSSPNDRPTPRKARSLKVLSLNCNSIKGKVKNCEFRSLIEQHDPHIILGCESKLNSSLATYSLFPDHYNVQRKDRTRSGGGVFCAIRNDLVSTEETSLDRDNECVLGIDPARQVPKATHRLLLQTSTSRPGESGLTRRGPKRHSLEAYKPKPKYCDHG